MTVGTTAGAPQRGGSSGRTVGGVQAYARDSCDSGGAGDGGMPLLCLVMAGGSGSVLSS